MKELAHEGDPCIHCGTPHDEVAHGNCPALDIKPKPMSFVAFIIKLKQQDCEHGQCICRTSDVLKSRYEVYKKNPSRYFTAGVIEEIKK